MSRVRSALNNVRSGPTSRKPSTATNCVKSRVSLQNLRATFAEAESQFAKSKSSARLKACQSEAEFLDKQLQKKSRVLSSHLCRRPLNVIIQKSSSNLGKTVSGNLGRQKTENDENQKKDTDLFLTKLGIDEYNFADEPLNDDESEGKK